MIYQEDADLRRESLSTNPELELNKQLDEDIRRFCSELINYNNSVLDGGDIDLNKQSDLENQLALDIARRLIEATDKKRLLILFNRNLGGVISEEFPSLSNEEIGLTIRLGVNISVHVCELMQKSDGLTKETKGKVGDALGYKSVLEGGPIKYDI